MVSKEKISKNEYVRISDTSKKLARFLYASPLLFMLFLGCGNLDFADKKEETSPQPVVRIHSSELEDNIKVAITGADPEKYTVQFSWPYIIEGKILRIRLGTVLTEVKPDQTFFTHTVDHNQTLNYSFDVLDSARHPEGTIRKSVIIPFDFVVRESNSKVLTNSKIQANRIFLTEDYPLSTLGRDVEVVANEIHSNSGTIEAFPEKIKNQAGDSVVPTAANQQNGASAGLLTVNSIKLFGKLKIVMRGERGGKGPKGDPTPGQGSQGSPSSGGQEECYEECKPQTCFTTNSSKILFGRPGRVCGCKNFGSPGSPGGKGVKGQPGKVGMTGGDAGVVKVNIQTYIPLEGIDPTLPTDGTPVVEIKRIPGDGGEGGEGGDGQRGGPGGPKLENRSCSGGQGPEGPAGDLGDLGPTGNSGGPGKKCLYIGSENINECD